MRLHALQYLRAIAALVVVYSHACIQVPAYQAELMVFGSFGVDIFFVISGFIMLYVTKAADRPLNFMVKRFRRVAPLYWFFTALWAVIYLVMPSVFSNAGLRIETFLKSLFFIPHFSDAHQGEVWPLVPPGWSLNYEMYFYALFALSLFAAERFRLLLISLFIVVVFVLANSSSSDSAIVEFFEDDVVFEFVFGMLLAFAWKRGLRISSGTGIFLFVSGFVLMLLYSQRAALGAPDLPGIITKGIPAAMIVAGTLFINIRESKLGVLLGDASYALYLSHIFVLGALAFVLPPILGEGAIAAYLFVLISLAICLIVSIPTHLYIDDWLLRSERIRAIRSPQQREA